MHMMDQIAENALIGRLGSILPRRPAQMNGLQESDAELIPLPDGTHRVLAATTDGVVEEIESGLYADPYLVGWMTVMANLSDLAAVGAEPLGLLVAETIPREFPEESLCALQQGIADACRLSSTHILGGDTNFSDRLHTTGTALGLIGGDAPMMRVRCLPGEVVFSTGPFGAGNAYALCRLAGTSPAPASFCPTARIREGVSLRQVASSCMDTSDGMLATLDQLGRLNNVGFILDAGWDRFISPEAEAVARKEGVHSWAMCAGPHGEFELVFTVPAHRVVALQQTASRAGWSPLRLGTVAGVPGIELPGWGTLTQRQSAAIRNHPLHGKQEISSFLGLLNGIEEAVRNSTEP
jgi:thiamine-monophosphate kinase